jgi:hypothetical protein
MSSIYFSEFYGISIDKEKDDWFDPRMTLDTNLCIDPFLVFKSNHPYFKNAKQKFVDFFTTSYSLASDSSNYDLLTEHILSCGEVKELCLGWSKTGINDNKRDKDFSVKVTNTLAKLSQKNILTPELFGAIEIFTDGIGKDRLSDAFANIIKRELIEYTLAVCERHPQIKTKYFPIENVEFNSEVRMWDDQFFYLPENPFEKTSTAVILVPKMFLRTIQSISSDELKNYLIGKPNDELRALLNHMLGTALKDVDNERLEKFRDKLRKEPKKTTLEIVNKKPELVSEFFNYVENKENENHFVSYDFEQDPDGIYTLPRKVYDFTSKHPLSLEASNENDFIDCVKKIIFQFRLFIENHDGYKLFWFEGCRGSSSVIQHRNESIVQTIFRQFVSSYCMDNKITLNCVGYKKTLEKNINCLGEKPIEFVFTNDHRNKVLIKLKLLPNLQLEKDDLEEALRQLKDNSINLCYYMAFLYYESEFDQISEKLKEAESVDTKGIQFKSISINASLNRLATLNPNLEYMLEEREVYISYKNGGYSEVLVDKLCETLKAEGIKFIRDKENLKYKDSLQEFIANLGRGKCVVTVISEEYLKAHHCMNEITQLSKNGNLIDRIVPIVLEDAQNIYDPIQSFKYLDYWKEKREEFNAKLGNVEFANTKGMRDYGDIIAEIERNSSQIIAFLRDLIVRKVKIGAEPDFTEALNEIRAILSKP